MASRLTWTLLLLALAAYGIWQRPLVLGLDLKGGVTMRYELEPPDTGAPPGQEVDSMIEASIETLRNRIDAYGIAENTITRQGDNELVIELPGSSKDEADSIKSLISRVGHLEFRIILRGGGQDDDARAGLVVDDERARLDEYLAREENQGRLPSDIDVSPLDIRWPDATDPEVIYRWRPYSDKIIAQRRGASDVDGPEEMEELLAGQPLTAEDYGLVKIEFGSENVFTGSDIEYANTTMDQRGAPAVGVSVLPSRASAFGDWTEPNKGRAMGIVLDGRLSQHPATIEDRLEGYFVIRSGSPAGFTESEIKEYLTIIKSGSLQMKPRLLYENTIGPSLGEASIRAGGNAALFGFLLVVVLMLVFYRLNGAVAAACLAVNLTLLAGMLMFLGATLTLPGIAGLVLTLGMAVDANILVFERIREETDRAKSTGQAVKLGFEKAFSTIVDANVTSFVTAFILFKVGTGPVRGFAVILMMGILTSVFSVLVFGRLVYEWLVARGVENLAMRRLIRPDTSWSFMGKARTALRVSAVVVVASLVAFFTADRDKYGLDFLGGYKAHVRLAEAATQGDVKAAIGTTFPRAQVVTVAAEDGSAAGASRQFVVKIKAEAGRDASEDRLATTYEDPLKEALAGRILSDFVTDLELVEDETAAATKVAATLHFDPTAGASNVPADAVASRFGFLSDLDVEPAGSHAVAVSGRWARTGLDPQEVVQRMRLAVADAGELPPPSEPFLESTMIGSRVGTELRDSAIRAILLSFIAIVLYIKVRFREYRYGFAAIIALAHDISITLGIVALMHFSGIVDVEIDLAMIAAFLTIIGYSLNDTIVLFDRVRENLPRLTGKSFTEVLDISINQTLGRTLLTSGTTMAALVIIFVFNYGRQNVLEGFSFAMIIGVLVGTYSSIFIASPSLLMIGGGTPRGATAASRGESGPGSKKKGGPAKQGVPA